MSRATRTESLVPGSSPLEMVSASSLYVSCSLISALAAPASSSSVGKNCRCTEKLAINPSKGEKDARNYPAARVTFH